MEYVLLHVNVQLYGGACQIYFERLMYKYRDTVYQSVLNFN